VRSEPSHLENLSI